MSKPLEAGDILFDRQDKVHLLLMDTKEDFEEIVWNILVLENGRVTWWYEFMLEDEILFRRVG